MLDLPKQMPVLILLSNVSVTVLKMICLPQKTFKGFILEFIQPLMLANIKTEIVLEMTDSP